MKAQDDKVNPKDVPVYNNLSSIGNYYGSLSRHKPKNSLISRIIQLLKDIWNGN